MSGSPDAGVVTFGEALAVLRTTEPGTLAHLSTLAVGTGGAEANVAIGLARLGVPVTWLGRVGADSLGRRVVRELRARAWS
jgi:2-dehydro-3-deoxygluconokinase